MNWYDEKEPGDAVPSESWNEMIEEIQGRAGGIYDPEYDGVVGDGEESENTAVATADDAALAAGRPLYFKPGTYLFDDNITIDSFVIFAPGAVFSIDSGKTVTFSKAHSDSGEQMFSGDGTIAYATGYKPALKPEWFGALPDNSTACYAAIQKCLTLLSAAGGGQLLFSAGTYQIADALLIDNSDITIAGVGNETLLLFSNAGHGFYFDNSEYISNLIFQNFQIQTSNASGSSAFYLDATTNAAVAINFINVKISKTGSGVWAYGINSINAQSSSIINIDIVSCNIGIYLHTTANQWTITNPLIQGVGIGIWADAAGCTVIGGTIQGHITDAGYKGDGQGHCLIGVWFELTGGGEAIELGSSLDGVIIAGCSISSTATNGVVIGVAESGQHSIGVVVMGNAFGPGELVINDEVENAVILGNRFHVADQITNNGVRTLILNNARYDGTVYPNTIPMPLVLSGANTHTGGSLTASAGVTYTLPDIYASGGIRMDYYPSLDADILFSLELNEGAGSVAHDSSPIGWDGAITGAAWGSGNFGKHTLEFDGTTDRLTIADNASNRLGTSDFTMEFLATFTADTGPLLCKGNDNWHDGNIWLYKEGSALISFQSTPETTDYTTTRFTVNNDGVTYNHICIVKSGADYYAYKDGVLVQSSIGFFDVGDFDNANTWALANKADGSDGLVTEMAYFRIYKRAFAAQEVKDQWLRACHQRNNIVVSDKFRVIGTDGAEDLSLSSGSMTITGDLSAAGGFRKPFDFTQENVAASQSAVALVIPGTVLTEYVMPFAGSVVAITVASNEARSAGTLTVDATINGTVTGLQAVLDDDPTTYAYGTQAKDTDAFSAGDRLGVKITTDGDWAPTTADIMVTVEVEA